MWVIQAVNYLDIVSEQGHSFEIYYYFVIYNYPKIFSKVLPTIFFVSLFYTILKYENSNELKIFWINGINKMKFVNILIKYTIIFFTSLILYNTLVNPMLQDKSRVFIKSSSLDFFPSLLQEKKFVDTVQGLTFYIEEKLEGNKYLNIIIKDDLSKQSRIIIAKKGELLDVNNQKILKLIDGKYLNINNAKTTHFNFEETDFNLSNFLKINDSPQKIQEINSLELIKCIKTFYSTKKIFIPKVNCTDIFIPEIQEELYKRFFKPLYLFLITVLLGFLLLTHIENKNFNYMRYFIFATGIVLIFISEISVSFSGKSILLLNVALFFPVILSLLLYLILNKKLKGENAR